MKIAVIGGGAAGMFAAANAGKRGADVTLFERNERMGNKLRITGKGRCNVTNNCDRQTFYDNVVSNPRFLYSAYSGFSCSDTMDYFEGLGVPLKTERGGRVFPASDKASDIVSALVSDCKKGKVRIINERVVDLIVKGSFIVKTPKNSYTFDKVILATGGKSYPKTGSDGNGYAIARSLGHNITALSPSLVPLVCSDGICGECQGLSLRNVILTAYDTVKKKTVYEELGEMIFTGEGVSGPLVLSASARMKDITPGRYQLYIDLKPALDTLTLDKRILRDFSENINKDFKNSLSALLPSKLIDPFVRLTGISKDKKVNSVSASERKKIVDLLKRLTLHVTCTASIDEAIITRGGVDTKQIDPKTMQSKIVPGLYFAGEIIDCDAYTGGFNLQIAFSTAYAASNAASEPDKRGSMKTFRIAIDGPSGAGKSTVAKLVAKTLGFVQVDTGAMYRSIGLYVFRAGISPEDKPAVIGCLPDIKIDLGFTSDGQKVYLNGEDVSTAIRQNEISAYASKVSAIPEVRSFLLDLQRKIAHEHSVVMDGRDIGTVILPDAELKVFQFASSEARAKRRYDELIEKGQTVDLEQIKKEIEERDYNDSHRATAPCVPAEDAVMIDNSHMTIEENVNMIVELYNSRK